MHQGQGVRALICFTQTYRLPAVEAKGFTKCRILTSIKLSHLTCFQRTWYWQHQLLSVNSMTPVKKAVIYHRCPKPPKFCITHKGAVKSWLH